MPRKQGEVYLGNPLLKGPNVKIDYTKEEFEEYLKCSNDPIHFMEKFMNIVTGKQIGRAHV